MKKKFNNKISNDLLPRYKLFLRQNALIEEDEKNNLQKRIKSLSLKEPLQLRIPPLPESRPIPESIPSIPSIPSKQNNNKYKIINDLFINYHFNDSDIENIRNQMSNYTSYSTKDINYVKRIIIFYFLFKYLLLIIGEITYDLRDVGILYIDGGLSIILNNPNNINYKTYDIDLKYIPIGEINIESQIKLIKEKFNIYSKDFSDECKKININDIEILKNIKDEKAIPIIKDIIDSIKNSIEFNIVCEEDIKRGIIKFGIKYKYKTSRKLDVETPIFNIIDISVCNTALNSYKLFEKIKPSHGIFYEQKITDNFIINFVNKDYLNQKIELLLSDNITEYIDAVPDIALEKTLKLIKDKTLVQKIALNSVSDGRNKRKSIRKLKKSKRKSIIKLKKSKRKSFRKKKKSLKRSIRKLKKSIKRKKF